MEISTNNDSPENQQLAESIDLDLHSLEEQLKQRQRGSAEFWRSVSTNLTAVKDQLDKLESRGSNQNSSDLRDRYDKLVLSLENVLPKKPQPEENSN